MAKDRSFRRCTVRSSRWASWSTRIEAEEKPVGTAGPLSLGGQTE
jgi:hypothetical protein